MATYKKDPVTGQIVKVDTTAPLAINPYTTADYKPYGQTSVTPPPPVSAPAPAPIVSPTPTVMPQAPTVSPQTQQIQTQIDETKAKIKEFQNIQSLMGAGYEVKAPGEIASPGQEDVLSGLLAKLGPEKPEAERRQEYTDWLRGQMDIYKTELGIPGKEKVVTGLEEQIRNTTELLDKLEGDINSRIGGFGVIEAGRRRMLATEQKPLISQLGELGRTYAPAQAELTGARGQYAEMLGLAEKGYAIGKEQTPQQKLRQMIVEAQIGQALAPSEKPTEVSAGATLIDPRTGKVIYQAPKIKEDEILTPNEAATLGVPYGTTKLQAAQFGITPEKIIDPTTALLKSLQIQSAQQSLAGIDPKKVAEAKATFASADSLLSQVESMARKVITVENPWDVPGQYIGGQLGAITKFNPDASVFLDTTKAFSSLLTRAAGEKGMLTDVDVQRIINALPKLTDTKSIME